VSTILPNFREATICFVALLPLGLITFAHRGLRETAHLSARLGECMK